KVATRVRIPLGLLHKSLAPQATLQQVVDEWWRRWPRLAPTTALNYRQNLNLHVLPLLGGRRVAEIRPRLIAEFLRRLSDDGLAPGTVRKVRTVLSAVMSY